MTWLDQKAKNCLLNFLRQLYQWAFEGLEKRAELNRIRTQILGFIACCFTGNIDDDADKDDVDYNKHDADDNDNDND